jgi:hypothetical protein
VLLSRKGEDKRGIGSLEAVGYGVFDEREMLRALKM